MKLHSILEGFLDAPPVATGRPLITRDSAAAREVLSPDVSACLVPPGDGEALAATIPLETARGWLDQRGVGEPVDPDKPFVIVSQHPVTTEYGQGIQQVTASLNAVRRCGLPAIVLWPNADAGSEDIARGIRLLREHDQAEKMHFFKNLPTETYIRLMARTACLPLRLTMVATTMPWQPAGLDSRRKASRRRAGSPRRDDGSGGSWRREPMR